MQPVRDRSLRVERAIIRLVRASVRLLPGRKVAVLMRDGAELAEEIDRPKTEGEA